MDCIVYVGVSWHKRPSGHYHNKRRGYLHRFIWQEKHGQIPHGFVIHHIDHDVNNNDISNLALMSKSDHQRHHAIGRVGTERQREVARENLKRARHPKQAACIHCANQFISTASGQPGKFCSTRCLELWRVNAFKPEIRKCIVCSSEYLAKKSFQRYCCKRCNAKSTVRTYRTEANGGKKRRKVAELKDVQLNC